MDAAARASVLGPGIVNDDVEACLEASEAAALVDGGGGSGALCGIDAAAHLLELLAAAPPPLLGEGIPVPTLCISGAADALVTADEVAAEAEHHNLAACDVIVLPAPAPHLIGYGGAATRDALTEAVVGWVSARW
jgi:hypothetical protein